MQRNHIRQKKFHHKNRRLLWCQRKKLLPTESSCCQVRIQINTCCSSLSTFASQLKWPRRNLQLPSQNRFVSQLKDDSRSSTDTQMMVNMLSPCWELNTTFTPSFSAVTESLWLLSKNDAFIKNVLTSRVRNTWTVKLLINTCLNHHQTYNRTMFVCDSDSLNVFMG